MRKNYNVTPTTNPALEYAAILSGLSMGGDFITDSDIKQARQIHTQKYGDNVGFNFVSTLASARR